MSLGSVHTPPGPGSRWHHRGARGRGEVGVFRWLLPWGGLARPHPGTSERDVSSRDGAVDL